MKAQSYPRKRARLLPRDALHAHSSEHASTKTESLCIMESPWCSLTVEARLSLQHVLRAGTEMDFLSRKLQIPARQATAGSESDLQSPDTAPYGACWPMECRCAGKICHNPRWKDHACFLPCTPTRGSEYRSPHGGSSNRPAGLSPEWSGLLQAVANCARYQ